MLLKPAFGIADTHRILHEYKANIQGSSEGLGWTSAFASIQRERPYAGKLHALSDSLVVLHRGGPVDLTYRIEGKSVIRHIPKGGVFFLPAGHECDVELHAALDSTHIYLRSELFINEENPTQSVVEGLAPMLGERDGVIEHLAAAIGDAVVEGQPVSSLFVDPIAKAIANRFVTISYRGSAIELVKSPHRLTNRQLSKLRDFVESNLDADIRLSAMASNCGLNTEYFVRVFKATMGISPYQYVISLRVERAKILLCDDRQSLADIAVQCGFSHQEHMTRLFRRLTGVTPGRYRRGNH